MPKNAINEWKRTTKESKKSHGNHSQVCPIEIELIVEMFMYLHFLTRFYLLHVGSLKSRAATHLISIDGLKTKKKMWRKIFLAPFHKNIHFNSSPPLVFLKLFCYCASSCAFDFTLSIMLACWHLAHTYFYTLMPSMLLSSFH